MARSIVIAASALALALSTAAPADAQRRDRGPRARGSAFAVEAFAGGARFGRFLEQRVETPGPDRERELTASAGLALGGGLNLHLWDKTSIRLGFTYVPTEFEFEVDDGVFEDGVGIGSTGARDLNLYAASASVLRLLGPDGMAARPYAVGGVVAGWWRVGEEDEAGADDLIVVGDEDTLFRLGATGGIGLQLEPTTRIVLRVEATTLKLRSPFDGDDALRVATGETFDEPDATSATRFSLGVAVNVGGR